MVRDLAQPKQAYIFMSKQITVMNNKIDYHLEWTRIKNEVMESEGFDEDDMCIDSIEGRVNDKADYQFEEEFGFSYYDYLEGLYD
jgi:hypothetical protein